MSGTEFFIDLGFTFVKNGYEQTNFSKEVTNYGVWTIKIEYRLNTRTVALTLIEVHSEDTNSETVKIAEVGVTPEIVIYHKEY